MIKTEFMGWSLISIYRYGQDGGWRARYARYLAQMVVVEGEGHTPEAALAAAHKAIKQGSKQ